MPVAEQRLYFPTEAEALRAKAFVESIREDGGRVVVERTFEGPNRFLVRFVRPHEREGTSGVRGHWRRIRRLGSYSAPSGVPDVDGVTGKTPDGRSILRRDWVTPIGSGYEIKNPSGSGGILWLDAEAFSRNFVIGSGRR